MTFCLVLSNLSFSLFDSDDVPPLSEDILHLFPKRAARRNVESETRYYRGEGTGVPE